MAGGEGPGQPAGPPPDGSARRRASARSTRTLRALLRQTSDSGELEASDVAAAPATAPSGATAATPPAPTAPRSGHRFSLRLYASMLALFVVLFGVELWLDLRAHADALGISFGELWYRSGRSGLAAAQAGSCLARAGYCMLAICLSTFLLAIPFAATLYTPKLAELYLADRTNRAIFALGVLASANTHFQTTVVWDRLALAGGAALPAGYAGFYPAVALGVSLLLVAAAWAAILPYAFYAWRFLGPEVLMAKLEAHLGRDLTAAIRPGMGAAEVEQAKVRARQGILDLSNLALRAVDRADRDLTLDGVRALARSYMGYLDVKAELPPPWFEPERRWFTGLSEEAFALILRDRLWVGHLLLHQAWLAYAAALTKIPDAAPAVAAIILRIGGEAARRGDWALLGLGQRFANTLLREAVKRAEPRVVQGVLYGYQDLLRRLSRVREPGSFTAIEQAAGNLRYYAEVAWAAGAIDSGDLVAMELARTVDLAAAEAPLATAEVVARVFEGLRLREGASLDGLRAAAATASDPAGREAFGFEAVR